MKILYKNYIKKTGQDDHFIENLYKKNFTKTGLSIYLSIVLYKNYINIPLFKNAFSQEILLLNKIYINFLKSSYNL